MYVHVSVSVCEAVCFVPSEVPPLGVFCLLVDEGNEGWAGTGKSSFGQQRSGCSLNTQPSCCRGAAQARKRSVTSYNSLSCCLPTF